MRRPPALGAGYPLPGLVRAFKIPIRPEAKLDRGLDGLFRPPGGDPLPADAAARLTGGALEGSNVNAVETMVAMISAARQFEHQMKMMHNAERKEEQAAKLLGTV